MAIAKEGKSGQHQGKIQIKAKQTIKPGEGSRGRSKRTLQKAQGVKD